ncbi:Hint domain-containing protein [Stigmatella erecta]|nr:Hint domain-containing protein [Stigmatella erecta]
MKGFFNRSRAVVSCFLPLALGVAACSQQKPPAELTVALRQELSNDSLAMSRAYAQWASTQPREKSQMPVDLADSSQYRFVMNRLRASGNTPQNSPRLFARLEQSRAKAVAATKNGVSPLAEDDWCWHFIANREAVVGNKAQFTQDGTVTCPGKAEYAYVDVSAYNTNAEHTEYTMLGSSSTEGYTEAVLGTEELKVDINVAPGRELHLDSMTIAYDDTRGLEQLTYAMVANAVPDRESDLTLLEPTERIGGAPIRVCLERGSAFGNLDCDYASVNKTGNVTRPFQSPYTGLSSINRTESNNQHTWVAQGYWPPRTGVYDASRLYLPMKGSFDPGAANGSNCEITDNLQGTADIILIEAGGRCKSTKPGDTVASAALDWKPTIPVQLTRDFDGLVDFGTDCLGYEQDVQLVVSVKATAKCGAQHGVPRARSNKEKILDFKNSCLAEGTQVLRADGNPSPVEKIQVGEKVLSNAQGRALTVTTVSKGIESRKMVHLRDAQGRDVMVTSKHPLLTAEGKVLAAEALKAGDVVQTQDGVTRLSSVERVPYNGQVYNLTLGTDEELATVGRQERTLIANGFRVGDNQMQTELERQTRSPENILAKLSKPWHQDYHNDLARREVKASRQP